MQELRRSSQENETAGEWQSPKIVLPRLPNKKAGSLPSYTNLKTGGDYSRVRGENTSVDDCELEVIRTVDFPKVSARAWLIYNCEADLVIKSCASKARREIASLTKLMSAFCTVELCERYHMTPKETYFRVTETSVDVSGTIANLQSHQWISIHDLLHGLMLPSGNDAANLLAENLGAILYFDAKGETEMLKEIKSIDLTEDEDHIDLYLQYFMDYMNATSRRMNLRNTKFTNPHGLDFRNNYSCCEDLLRLTLQCSENEYLQKICSTKQHKAEVRIYRNKIMYRKAITWQNTNKLLGERGCRGLKTGYTPKAGGCLSSVFDTELPTGGSATLVVIVLGSKSQQHRFRDTTRLMEYASEQLRYMLK